MTPSETSGSRAGAPTATTATSASRPREYNETHIQNMLARNPEISEVVSHPYYFALLEYFRVELTPGLVDVSPHQIVPRTLNRISTRLVSSMPCPSFPFSSRSEVVSKDAQASSTVAFSVYVFKCAETPLQCSNVESVSEVR